MRIIPALLIAAVAGAPAVSRAQAAAKLDDAAIVGIFDAANTWDIETGALAAKNASDPDVKAFGQALGRDHGNVQKQGRDLAKKLGVTPTPVAKTFALAVQHEAAMKKLNGLTGAAFDKALLEHEVAYHQAVIDAVTTQFLPAIQNAELKAFVTKVAPAFQAHLDHAKALLGKKK